MNDATRLRPAAVRQLVFEGGAGKGFAFIGALEALERHRVLRFIGHRPTGIDGVAGASAGAITAMLVASGYSAARLRVALASLDLEAELLRIQPEDTLGSRVAPADAAGQTLRVSPIDRDRLSADRQRIEPPNAGEDVGWGIAGGVVGTLLTGPVGGGLLAAAGAHASILKPVFELIGRIGAWRRAVSALDDALRLDPSASRPTTRRARDARVDAERDVTARLIELAYALELDAWMRDAEGTDAVARLLRHLGQHFETAMLHLLSDGGLFSGHRAQAIFESLMRAQAERSPVGRRLLAGRPTGLHLTFAEHERIFGARLVVTGSNLTTLKSHLFSARTTPRFPVSTAVRISMGIPLLFKPVVLDETMRAAFALPESFVGGWVDGGLLNNAPHRAFDHLDPSTSESLSRQTLLLRLSQDPRRILTHTALGVLSNLLPILLGNEFHVADSWGLAQNTILLDALGLDGLDFSPSPDVAEPAIRAAAATVDAYFRG